MNEKMQTNPRQTEGAENAPDSVEKAPVNAWQRGREFFRKSWDCMFYLTPDQREKSLPAWKKLGNVVLNLFGVGSGITEARKHRTLAGKAGGFIYGLAKAATPTIGLLESEQLRDSINNHQLPPIRGRELS